ncbi:MAG: diacylglycerol kinase family protein [Sphingorhabdus sp.]
MLVQLIHNPASGTHDESRLSILKQAFEACGASVVSGQTSLTGEINFSGNIDLICVSGGDGALRQVVAEMARQDISASICVFPAGTVNLVAKELGYSSDPELFAREIMAGFLDKNDGRLESPLITSDNQPFVACISAGPDGQAVARHSPALKKRIGGAAYAWSLVKLLGNWPKLSFSLALETPDGSTRQMTSSAFYVIKAHHYAGKWTLAPAAGLATDIFHIVSLNRGRRRDFIRFIVGVAIGRDPAKFDFIQTLTAHSLSITPDDDESRLAAFQVDGDMLSEQPRLIKMAKRRITYCLPRPD